MKFIKINLGKEVRWSLAHSLMHSIREQVCSWFCWLVRQLVCKLVIIKGLVGRSLAPAWTEYISDWQMDKRTSERTKLRYSMKGRIGSLSKYREYKKYASKFVSYLIG